MIRFVFSFRQNDLELNSFDNLYVSYFIPFKIVFIVLIFVTLYHYSPLLSYLDCLFSVNNILELDIFFINDI